MAMALLHFVIAASAVLVQRVAAVATKAPHAAAHSCAQRRALLALTCATPLSARARGVEDMLATDTATMLEDPANAVRGPVARTVQTSKLGVAVRRAVVKSAQFDDALTRGGTRYRTSCARNRRHPAPRPPPKPVDVEFAAATRRCGIDACCAAARVSPRAVEDAIAAGRDTYASLYEGKSAFGLETYAAFRAFNSFLEDDAAAAVPRGTALGRSFLIRRPAAACARNCPRERHRVLPIFCDVRGGRLCGGVDVPSPPDAEDLADLASRKAWGL